MRDVGMTLQNRLYYDEAHLDLILSVITTYKDQSKRCATSAGPDACALDSSDTHSYLDAIVHLTYVLMRMLEKYSKNTDAMFVRKKKGRKKRKAKGAPPDLRWVVWFAELCTAGEDDGGVEHDMPEEDDPDRPQRTFAEHAFQFDKFEKVRHVTRRYRLRF
jgi:replication fork protection complex subunit Tof1/Swi1